MFRQLRVKRKPDKVVPDLGRLSARWLTRNPNTPVTLRQINNLPENAKRRTYRALLPPELLTRFGINPITWQGPDGDESVLLRAKSGTSAVSLSVRKPGDPTDDFLLLELQDNALNGVDLSFLLLQDPGSPRFATDRDEDGRPTLFGMARRHLVAEQEAKTAGLAPAQVRRGLGASQQVFQHVEAFLVTSGHAAYFVEPLTYVSAWLFERRGFAYVRGHKLMDDIHREFGPGGRLRVALDNSSPFRQADQWETVRGRAWAIHDGILGAIDASWNNLRMIKRIGRHAQVDTFPNASY